MRAKRGLLIGLCAVLLIIALPLVAGAAPLPIVLVQDDGPEDEPAGDQAVLECTPAAQRLADEMGVDCSVILAYQAQGVGLGVIAQAFALSQAFPALSWEDLLARHTSDEALGWGNIKKAYWLAELLGADAEELLAAHSAGTGWGETLQAYRTEPGKPPWAVQGPPPWSNGRGPVGDNDAEGDASDRAGNSSWHGRGGGQGNSDLGARDNGQGRGANK